ncbi:hypothetical protein MD273_08680 [Marinobacter pelagius]|uniref:hypothetical protein n=1 Tax=Marinobacter sp. C7 TaxID=2951363 RepID=UPI001EF0E688|nr:hypothetical protein [Marinobacter sp. C7]MCG7199796.1 hypothetical protein [Marinobacter sp. C7]
MRYIAALLFAMFFAGAAVAGQCPALMSQIDQQLQTAQLDSETEASVKALRDQGESLHKQGKHAESVKVLREAMQKMESAS